jgi:galactonate dehydratase
MKISLIESFPIRLPRDLAGATGTAGSPTVLDGTEGNYRWSRTYPALYSVCFETALVRVTLEDGTVGWGEAQAPLAPEVACTIIDRLLAPVLTGLEFDGSVARIEQLWATMYSTMRVRGQTGGFMMDAISGIDIALWDLAGKLAGKSVSELLGAGTSSIPAYLSGLPPAGGADEEFRVVKLYHNGGEAELLRSIDSLKDRFDIAVDALWRFEPDSAAAFGRELDARNVLWFECPLPPEDPQAHAAIARRFRTPIALGESYRTHFELASFMREGAMKILQPDIGRTGITEGLRIARAAASYGIAVIPHVSIAMGPQVAAAIHFAAAAGCNLLEYNPSVLEMANRHLRVPIEMRGARYVVPREPGLGVEPYAFR